MLQEAQSAGVAATLGLNWKLFVAQLVNFGVIIFVVWKWVYGPLMRAMDERAKKIEQGLKDADASKSVREQIEKEREKLILEARGKAREIIEAAESESAKRQAESLDKAKSEVERVVVDGKQRLRDEQAAMIREAKSEVAELVVAAVERVLREKVDAKKDAKLIKEALER